MQLNPIKINDSFQLPNNFDIERDKQQIQCKFIEAAKNGNLATLASLIDRKIDPNFFDEKGRTPLVRAIQKKQVAAIELLLKAGASIELASPKRGLTPLIFAENRKITKLLLDYGALIDGQDKEGRTDLHWSVKCDNFKIASLLLDCKASTEMLTDKGYTPLMMAAKRGHTSLVDLLLKRGANLNKQDKKGDTALMIAVKQNNKEIVQLLLEASADYTIENLNGNNAILQAIHDGNTEIVELFVKKGIDFNFPDSNGVYPLQLAVAEGKKIITKILLDANAKVDVGTRAPLMLSIIKNQDDIALLLLKKGANANCKNKDGNTALIIACAKANVTLAKALIQNGACIDSSNNEGVTPLIVAARMGASQIVELLINNHANPLLQGKEGHTAWIEAKQCCHTSVARLLASKMDPNELKWQKEALKALAIGHSCDVQKQYIPKNSSCHAFTLHAGHFPYWLKKMSKASSEMNRHHPELMSTEECHHIQDLLQSGSNLFLKDFNKLIKRAKQNEPLLIPISSHGHLRAALIWGPYLVLCDRGHIFQKMIKVFQYDRDSLDEKILEAIDSCQRNCSNEEEFNIFISEKLSKLLGFKDKGNFEQALEGACPLTPQKSGTCSWSSIEGPIWAYFVLREALNRTPGFTLEENTAVLSESITSGTLKFSNWRMFNQFYHLERYLNIRALRNGVSDAPSLNLHNYDWELVALAIDQIERNCFPQIVTSKVIRKIRSQMQAPLAISCVEAVAAKDAILGKQCQHEIEKLLENQPDLPTKHLYRFLDPVIEQLLLSKQYEKIKTLLDTVMWPPAHKRAVKAIGSALTNVSVEHVKELVNLLFNKNDCLDAVISIIKQSVRQKEPLKAKLLIEAIYSDDEFLRFFCIQQLMSYMVKANQMQEAKELFLSFDFEKDARLSMLFDKLYSSFLEGKKIWELHEI